jgi:DNA polymerase III delta subunit
MTKKNKTVLQIDESLVRKIIIEELTSSVDHKAVAAVLSKASKLLAAIETFKKEMSVPVANAVTPHLGALEQQLLAMVDKPSSYVDQLKNEPVVRKFKPVTSDKE